MTLPAEIRTERLLLRPYRFADVEAVLAYAADEEWSRYTLAPYPYDRAEAEKFIARCVLEDPAERASWAVTLGGDGEPIGGVHIALDLQNRAGELGWSIARRHWGKSYAGEAARAVIDASFRAYPELNRVRAHAAAENPASLRVMEKLGMTREGCLRQNRVLKGRLIDEVHFGMLRSEWSSGGEAALEGGEER